MAGIPFPDNMTTAEAAEVNDKVSQVVQKWNETGSVKFYSGIGISPVGRRKEPSSGKRN